MLIFVSSTVMEFKLLEFMIHQEVFNYSVLIWSKKCEQVFARLFPVYRLWFLFVTCEMCKITILTVFKMLTNLWLATSSGSFFQFCKFHLNNSLSIKLINHLQNQYQSIKMIITNNMGYYSTLYYLYFSRSLIDEYRSFQSFQLIRPSIFIFYYYFW